MRTITIEHYDQLSRDQWRRLATTAKRHMVERTGQPCEIGIGRKVTDGQTTDCSTAVRVYLPHKRPRVPVRLRVPQPFEIRLRRKDGRYELVRVTSDVESLSAFVPTSLTVKAGGQQATAGLIVRWMDSRADPHWGFATVAHLFDTKPRRAATIRFNSRLRFRCRLHRTASRRTRNDLCVLRIVGDADETRKTLIDHGLINAQQTRPSDWLSVDEVHRCAISHTRGNACTPWSQFPCVGEEVFPNGFRIGTRRLDDCIRVGGAPPDSFQRGTSGSLWRFEGRFGCMQVGGKTPNFCEGIGQPIARYVDWFHKALGRDCEIVAALTCQLD